MSSLQSIVGTIPGYFIYFAALLLVGAQLTVVIYLIQERLGGVRLIASLLHFLIGLFFLVLLLNYSYDAVLEARPEVLHTFEVWLLDLPWLFYAGLELVSAFVICLYIQFFRKYRETHLTKDAIRQTVDHLPTGLMVSEPDGTVLLANLKMTELCWKLTGELLSDARRFWQFIEHASTDYMIRTDEGETWQFTKSRLSLNGCEYDQLTAVDMTEQYLVTEQLSRKNLHLKEVQDRMKAVAAKERSLVAEREIMSARMTVHNRMGAVLLSGKYYLDHPENVKEEELLRLLEFNNHFLLGEAEQPESNENSVQESISTAGRIGVRVEISGELPKSETAGRIIAQAIDQCATNTVRHAGGDCLRIALTENETAYTASFTNNGAAPKGPLTETGGLAVLRKAVETAGGSMTIQSDPEFLLTISIPKYL